MICLKKLSNTVLQEKYSTNGLQNIEVWDALELVERSPVLLAIKCKLTLLFIESFIQKKNKILTVIVALVLFVLFVKIVKTTIFWQTIYIIFQPLSPLFIRSSCQHICIIGNKTYFIHCDFIWRYHSYMNISSTATGMKVVL